MTWWDELWLNEGFATWMPGKTLAAWKPEWDVETSNTSERLSAMNADNRVTARKIRQPATTKDDIADAFDGITYGKAGAIIHMFEQWLGPEVFRRGVKGYMDKHAHGNATADFLRALGAAAGRDIAPAFSTFLDQAGIPQVAVELRCEQGRPPALELSQKRYLPLGSPRQAQQTWQIPVCFEYGTGQISHRECALLKDVAAEIPIQTAKACPDWVLLNDEYNGYFRSQYTAAMLNRVLDIRPGSALPSGSACCETRRRLSGVATSHTFRRSSSRHDLRTTGIDRSPARRPGSSRAFTVTWCPMNFGRTMSASSRSCTASVRALWAGSQSLVKTTTPSC